MESIDTQAIIIGICDDEIYFREELENLVRTYGNEGEYNFEIKSFETAEGLADDIISNHQEYHLLFLDVEMEGMSGMEAAIKLRENGFNGSICFVTSKEYYAYDAFQVEAIGYVRKPAKYQDVKKHVKKALVEINYKQDEEEAKKRYLETTFLNEKVVIELRQILYLEKRRNQCVIHLEDSEIVCYEPLKNLYDRLDKNRFYYTHQGFVVNFDKIKEVKKDTVCLGGKREVPLSRRYHTQLRELYTDKLKRVRNERNYSS